MPRNDGECQQNVQEREQAEGTGGNERTKPTGDGGMCMSGVCREGDRREKGAEDRYGSVVLLVAVKKGAETLLEEVLSHPPMSASFCACPQPRELVSNLNP